VESELRVNADRWFRLRCGFAVADGLLRQRIACRMTTLDKILVSIDRRPFDAALRSFVGILVIPILSLLRQDVRSGSSLIIGLLVLMLSLRIVPVFVRKVLPLSPEVNAIWSERRQIAKRYDSFQWQKLFFTGMGLTCYMLISRELFTSTISVSGFCLLFGAIGMARWSAMAPKVRSSLVNNYVL